MNQAALYALMSIYWPFGAYGQSHPPEDPFYGTPLDYNQWVDINWSTYGPVYDYEAWKRDKLANQ